MNEELLYRAQEYAKDQGLVLVDELGHGVHGSVFGTESQSQGTLFFNRSAVKAYFHDLHFTRELDVYLRLQKKKLKQVRGFHIPQLIRYDENWNIIEMTIVTRPFVLDFAGAYLDKAPDFSDEVMADWREAKIEQFGKKRWPEVQAVLAILEVHGIFMEDVHPGNIAFADQQFGRSSSSSPR